MPEKLLTLQELSEYLGIKEEKITSLVDQGVLFAYKIGGELLRFRKEQIDATRAEIESRVTDADRTGTSEARETVRMRFRSTDRQDQSTLSDRMADFFYFSDFYIISAVLIIALLVVIFKG
jgi:excisionase family DNA binding protein